jgi:hypothetical protein
MSDIVLRRLSVRAAEDNKSFGGGEGNLEFTGRLFDRSPLAGAANHGQPGANKALLSPKKKERPKQSAALESVSLR